MAVLFPHKYGLRILTTFIPENKLSASSETRRAALAPKFKFLFLAVVRMQRSAVLRRDPHDVVVSAVNPN